MEKGNINFYKFFLIRDIKNQLKLQFLNTLAFLCLYFEAIYFILNNRLNSDILYIGLY
jgi:hypothetical protein